MARITIDGKQYDVDPKQTIIEAARDQGIHVPHFCWHPKLSVAGNCRICLVEVEKFPKLAIACATPVAEGMVVRTTSEKVINAREAVMEFLLINHPLDCPICDEAGECKLQDYAYKYSVGVSRFEFEKVRKPKRVELGPNVMLDTERCIMCSRCIRFCDEVAKEPQLVFTQRGDHVELTTFPDQKLDNPYSMNTIDLCPVGALTSQDFRFKARVWEMSSTDTVCIGCARGCNVQMWVRNNEILRLTPRFNPDVNEYWMSDFGRLETFKFVNSADRITSPMMRRDDELVDVSWDEAIATVASKLKMMSGTEIAAIGSSHATNEDNYLFSKLLHHLGISNVDLLDHIDPTGDDDILLRGDKTPNRRGARAVGVAQNGDGSLNAIVKAINSGSIKALYVLEDDVAAIPEVAEAISKLDFLIVHASNENATTRLADVVFASSTYAEKHGTMTNFEGRVQRIRPAVATAEQDRALDGFAMSRLDKFGAHNDRWTQGKKRDARPSWRIVASVAHALGAKWKYATAEDVFNEMAASIEDFKGLTYLRLGTRGAMLNSARSHTKLEHV